MENGVGGRMSRLSKDQIHIILSGNDVADGLPESQIAEGFLIQVAPDLVGPMVGSGDDGDMWKPGYLLSLL